MASSKTFQRKDGVPVTRLYSEPVHFPKAGGGLEPIRSSFVPSSLDGYAVRNQANAFRADLPRDLATPVRYAVGDRWVRFALDGASGRGALRDGKMRYAAAAPGVDVDYELRANGLRRGRRPGVLQQARRHRELDGR